MIKPIPLRFCVRPEHEAEAMAHLEERGFNPATVETDDAGLKTLVFSPLPLHQMDVLVRALPKHLSAYTAVIVGDNPPFRRA